MAVTVPGSGGPSAPPATISGTSGDTLGLAQELSNVSFALLPVRTTASQSPFFAGDTVVSSHGVVTGAPAFTIAAAVVMLDSTVQCLPRSAEVKSKA